MAQVATCSSKQVYKFPAVIMPSNLYKQAEDPPEPMASRL